MKNIKIIVLLILTFHLISCSSNDNPTPTPTPTPIVEEFIRAADVSYLPLIESEGTIYKHNGVAEDPLITLKNAGCNTIRIRLWKNPADSHCSLPEVKTLAARAKNAGFKVWLSVHYSDSWADPALQNKPSEWANLNFTDLKSSVSTYTSTVINEIHPDIYQIGNETNNGFLWPEGKLTSNEAQYLQLVHAASATIRSQSPTTKIMLHFAGIADSEWFFGKVHSIDYDYIGLSYYPVWHGKDLNVLQNTINTLSQTHNKKVVIAETAYPFTLNWNDWTNNIVGLDNQLIPLYPASNDGQKNYLLAIKSLLKQTTNGIGFCYWGTEWVAFRGTQSSNGSSFENQALWDFDINSLPAIEAFSKN